MFRRLTLLWTLLVLAAGGWTAWHLTRVRASDREQIIRLTDRMPLPQKERPHTGLYSQQRQGVRRDLWTPKGDGVRLQTVQWSETASLAASQREHALLEELTGVRCYVQEGIDAPHQTQHVSVLTADHATYDYRQMTLHAQPVSLERYVLPGIKLVDRIVDEKPTMVGQAVHAEFENSLQLKGGITVVTLEGMELHCEQAKIDREIGYGKFEAVSEGAYTLVRSEYKKSDGSDVIPLTLRSRSVELWMANSQVGECVAEGDARLTYGTEWTASGDRVFYERHGNNETSMNGIFQLIADRPKGCSVYHAEGSQISADRMILDSEMQDLTLYNVDGQLCTERGDLYFQADTARWGHIDQGLTLTGNVLISQGGRQLRAFGDVMIAFDSIADGVKVSRFECVGPTEMAMGSKGDRLRCRGVTTVDLQEQRMTLLSPIDSAGKAKPDEQLAYYGAEGELTSDRLTIDYLINGAEVIPKHFSADGHVCLARQTRGGIQYALADVLDYSPESGNMRFRALAPRRVIFFDRQYDLKVSAPEVQITCDKRTGQEKIQGLGDLRMTLLDQELAHLRKRFAIEGIKKS